MTDHPPPRTTLVMLDLSNDDGTMHRSVTLVGTGLVIAGQDLGDGVERIFGCREYEFERTLSAADTAALRRLLEVHAEADLLAAIEARFTSTHELETYLEKHGITGTFWSRTGD